MVKRAARTSDEYLAALPDDRRRALTAVRQVIRDHLPEAPDGRFRRRLRSFPDAPPETVG